MCRLLGYCARDRASLADLMTEPGLRHFSALSQWHGDGWGIAWYDDQQLHVEKSPGRAIDEPAYDKLTHCALGDVGLVHLRMATPGLPVEACNTHPFTRDGFALAHNGAIHPQDRLGELLPPEWDRQRTGITDSERYFLHVLADLERNGGDVVAALASTIDHIDSTFTANSLNAILLSPDALYAICCYHPERIPVEGLAVRGYTGVPERYFDLAYRVTQDAVVVASSGWPQDGWTFVPNRHVLVVDRRTLRISVEPLSPGTLSHNALRTPPAVTAAPTRYAVGAPVPA
jgi:predicted glutamine amidotransferase